MTVVLMLLALIVLAGVFVGGYYYNRSGPGDFVRDPNVKARRNNWVP